MGKYAWFSSRLVFSFYVYIPLSSVFMNRVSTYFAFKNETNIPFDLIKNSDCKTLHVDAAIFVS